VRDTLVERETVERLVAGGEGGPHDGEAIADRGPCRVVVGDLAGLHRRVARGPLERLATPTSSKSVRTRSANG
jgi:hypothetical protein